MQEPKITPPPKNCVGWVGLSRSPGKVRGSKEEEEEKKRENNNSVNSGHYVCLAAHLQRQPGSARSSLGPTSESINLPFLVN
jgi:hypothetical protein